MTKREKLTELEKEMAADKTLPLATNLVFGEGNIDCVVMFIGEAPGANEDLQKRPFVGRGGKLLDKNIERIGWKREQVYITNIVKRRPPDNRDPLPEEIAAYKPYLTRQIEIIQPKIIATLGRFSMNYFLPEAKISRDHSKIFRLDALRRLIAEGGLGMNGKIIFPIFHPAAALRGTATMKEFEGSFDILKKAAGKADELLIKEPKKYQ